MIGAARVEEPANQRTAKSDFGVRRIEDRSRPASRRTARSAPRNLRRAPMCPPAADAPQQSTRVVTGAGALGATCATSATGFGRLALYAISPSAAGREQQHHDDREAQSRRHGQSSVSENSPNTAARYGGPVRQRRLPHVTPTLDRIDAAQQRRLRGRRPGRGRRRIIRCATARRAPDIVVTVSN